LKETSSFRYPLDDYFPKTQVIDTDPPKNEREEKHHSDEDSYAPLEHPRM
jgi:hypothetical protein